MKSVRFINNIQYPKAKKMHVNIIIKISLKAFYIKLSMRGLQNIKC